MLEQAQVNVFCKNEGGLFEDLKAQFSARGVAASDPRIETG